MQHIRNLAKQGAVCIFAVAIAVAGAGFAQELDPTGDWDIEIDMGGSPMMASLTVIKNDDGTYSGILNSPMGELTLENVTYVPGESLSFNETVGEGDTAMEFKFEGKFSGPDNFEGMLESGMGPMPIKGKRAAFESPIAGLWKITSESQLGTLERDLVVYKSGKAKYVTEEQSFDVENLAVEGDAVTFDVTLDLQGTELVLAFEGTYDGDSLTGEFLADGSAVAEVSGTKAPAVGVESVAGEWEILADTPLGELVAKLTLADTGSKLTTDEGESEVTNLDIDSDFVQFDVTVIFEGGEYEVTFEGYNKGETLDGDFVMGGSPVASVVATRVASN